MPEQLPYSVTELFQQIAKGDETAFTQAFYHYNKRIYPYILRKVQSDSIAREMVQDVFLRLWLYRERLPGISNPEAYLYRIAANLLQDYFRRLGHEFKMKAVLTERGASKQVVENEVWHSETRKLLDEAIYQLPPQRKKVYQLRQDGHSYQEIAEIMGISSQTVKNQLIFATKFIKEFLTEKGLSVLICVILWEWF